MSREARGPVELHPDRPAPAELFDHLHPQEHPMSTAAPVAYTVEAPDMDTAVDLAREAGGGTGTISQRLEPGLYLVVVDEHPDPLVATFYWHAPRERSYIECACGLDFGSDQAWAEHLAAVAREAIR